MNFSEPQLIYPELSYQLNGILFTVHNERGRYCNESQYADAVEKSLKMYSLTYEREKILPHLSMGKRPAVTKLTSSLRVR